MIENDCYNCRQLRVLLLNPISGSININSISECERVASPLQCLHKAIENMPAFIVICFDSINEDEWDTRIELAHILKLNKYTCELPILALLIIPHRLLLEALIKAGVEFVRFVDVDFQGSETPLNVFIPLSEEDRLELHLARICPHINYSCMDVHHELIVCGAYLDRMVICRNNLKKLCLTEEHKRCEYYRRPRSKA